MAYSSKKFSVVDCIKSFFKVNAHADSAEKWAVMVGTFRHFLSKW